MVKMPMKTMIAGERDLIGDLTAERDALRAENARLFSENAAAEDRERARIVELIQSYPLGADGPADAIEREKFVLEIIITQIKREAA